MLMPLFVLFLRDGQLWCHDSQTASGKGIKNRPIGQHSRKGERNTRLSLCSVMFMFWYVYVLLCLCFVMFVLCCVYVLLYLCYVMCIFCYAYVLFVHSFLRDGKLWLLDSQSVAGKGIKNSYTPTFSIKNRLHANILDTE